MPIRAEMKALYPANWREISLAIRERAGQRCEQCGIPNYRDSARAKAENGGRPSQKAPRILGTTRAPAKTSPVAMATKSDGCGRFGSFLPSPTLDHDPRNCNPENLRAWCQSCHNLYDVSMRRAGTRKRAREARATAIFWKVRNSHDRPIGSLADSIARAEAVDIVSVAERLTKLRRTGRTISAIVRPDAALHGDGSSSRRRSRIFSAGRAARPATSLSWSATRSALASPKRSNTSPASCVRIARTTRRTKSASAAPPRAPSETPRSRSAEARTSRRTRQAAPR